MSTIMGFDLGKLKGVACLYDPDTTAARFTTVHTDPAGMRKLLAAKRPGLVVSRPARSPAASLRPRRAGSALRLSPTRRAWPGRSGWGGGGCGPAHETSASRYPTNKTS